MQPALRRGGTQAIRTVPLALLRPSVLETRSASAGRPLAPSTSETLREIGCLCPVASGTAMGRRCRAAHPRGHSPWYGWQRRLLHRVLQLCELPRADCPVEVCLNEVPDDAFVLPTAGNGASAVSQTGPDGLEAVRLLVMVLERRSGHQPVHIVGFFQQPLFGGAQRPAGGRPSA